jgi:uncharacterized protein (DUF169 family)
MMSTIRNYAKLSADLVDALHLEQPPVAICFSDSAPDGLDAPAKRVAAGCQFWEDATVATFATSAKDHEMCAIGVYTHHLQPTPAQQTDLVDALKVFGDLGYVRQEDLPMIPVLASEAKCVTYSPLAQSPLPPDVVLMFANANQILILTEATQQVEHQNAPAMGRPACAVVPQVMNTGRAALSLGCCGARAYLNIFTEGVALFAIPGAKLEAYTERVTALANANQILTQFHQIRWQDIKSGNRPTIQESLKALAAS